jgi:transposase
MHLESKGRYHMSRLSNGSLPRGEIVLPVLPVLPGDDAAQGARRATGDASSPGAPGAPDPEVAATGKRRRFSGTDKRRILEAADRCTRPGELGALMRKEGIYSSMLANWRKQRARGQSTALEARKRGRKVDPATAEARRSLQLQRENDRLRRQLAQAHEIIDVQKKLCNLLGLPTAPEPEPIE